MFGTDARPISQRLRTEDMDIKMLCHNIWQGSVSSGVRRNFSWGGGFIQWHRVVICIWCALFVTSQNDIIVLSPNQRFGEVCWHNMHIFLYIHSYFMCQCTEYKLLELQVRLSEENTYTQRYDTQFVTAKNIRRRVKTGEYNTRINSSEQFMEKWSCVNVLSNTSSRA